MGWTLLGETKETKETPEFKLLKQMGRALFKPDHPYRTKIGVFGTLFTAATGITNASYANAGISSCSEWASFDVLFDEFFVHTLTLRYKPRNSYGGGSSTSGVAGLPTVSGGAFNYSCGLIIVSLFNGASYYGTAAGMISNPTKMTMLSSESWSYPWRNNVKFDPRGPALSSSTAEAWQGWTAITGVASCGGTIQIRNFGDIVIGNGLATNTLGDLELIFDVSFRARA